METSRCSDDEMANRTMRGAEYLVRKQMCVPGNYGREGLLRGGEETTGRRE